jgi:hypothetical protein
MRRVVVAVLALVALWLMSAILVGLYSAADGGHGGKPSVILLSVGLGAALLFADMVLIRRVRGTKQPQA